MALELMLDVAGLTIVRDGIRILENLCWRIESGQHWVVMGPNGSGKTSLIAALTGYLLPTKGSIELFGHRFGESDWRELRTRVGIVSSTLRQLMADSEPALSTVASGRHAMIDYWGTPSGEESRQALQLLRNVECVHLARRPWGVLSQGERQRVLIARALMARPRLLILDEPCAGLDPVARERFLNFIDEMGRRSDSPPLVLVTHHIEEVTPVFTHGLLLGPDDGRGRVMRVQRRRPCAPFLQP